MWMIDVNRPLRTSLRRLFASPRLGFELSMGLRPTVWMKVALLRFIDSKREVLLSGPMPFVKTRGGGVDDRENRTTSIPSVNAGD